MRNCCGSRNRTSCMNRRFWRSRRAACWPIRRPPRSADNFAGQWLYLRELKSARPETRDFNDNLRQSFRRETELLFESIMREDRNVVDLLNADYTFVDERLAEHYGIPGRLWQPLSPGEAAGRFAPWIAGPGQHPAGHLGRNQNLSGGARQVGSRKHPRHLAAAASAQRTGVARRRRLRRKSYRCAKRWRRIERIRSARPVTRSWIRSDSRWRTSISPEHGARPMAACRSIPPVRWWMERNCPGPPACARRC